MSAVHSDTPLTVLYMPAYEQSAAAEADRSWFASQGITVADSSRWLRGNVTYADGWATGRLVRIPAAEITAAYGDGRLRPTDVLLLTDGVPAEVPFVRGIITLTPATPNSHVAILARNQQMPFAWVQNADEQQRILQLDGRPVLLRVGNGRVDVSRLDDPLQPSSRGRLAHGAANAGPGQHHSPDGIRQVAGGCDRPDARQHQVLRRQGQQLRPVAAHDPGQFAAGDGVLV